MKKIITLFLTIFLIIACEKQPIPDTIQIESDTLSGNITENKTLYSNKKYYLSGFVYVKNNATLTIEPGTLIKGVSGTKATLIIEKDSKLIAKGTASKPIIFTSDKPKGQRAYGDWGGIVICGNAPTNKHDLGTGIGVTEGGIGSQYGGTIPNDNSGTLEYVRIEFPGIPLTATANSEINGLTLYSVGNGTTINHIQVSFSGDDSFEWFGGNVNAKYLVAYKGWDDDFDTDNGFNGNIQFFLGVRDPIIADQSQSNSFESDNDADGSILSPYTSPLFSNGTILGPLYYNTTINPLFKNAIQTRRGSRLSIYNSVLVGYPNGLYIDGQKGDSPTQITNGNIQIENCVMSQMSNNYVTTYLANTESWYLSKNEILTDIKLQGYMPILNSPLLSGASFTNQKLLTFENVTYRGAFGITDWTTNWCNFDPQNTDY